MDRDRERQRWLEKYGEEIDTRELTRIASVAAVERGRVRISALRQLQTFADLMKGHREETRSFALRKTPGESSTLADRFKTAWSAAEDGEPRRIASVRVLEAFGEALFREDEISVELKERIKEIEAQEKNARENPETQESEARIHELEALALGVHPDIRSDLTASQRRILRLIEVFTGSIRDERTRSLARTADPGELLQALIISHRWFHSRSREMAMVALRHAPGGWSSKTKAPDAALAEAAHGVAEWVRAHHRDRQGNRDGRVKWTDVVTCLEIHGNDLRQIAGRKDDAIRRLVERWRKQVKRDRAELDAAREARIARRKRTKKARVRKRRVV